jgi:hypothetical protein
VTIVYLLLLVVCILGAVWAITNYFAWLAIWRRNNPDGPFNWRVLIGAQLYIPWVFRQRDQRHRQHRRQPKQWTEDQL